MGAVTLVLLIACARTSPTCCSRAPRCATARCRSAPHSARARWRIVRQLLTESPAYRVAQRAARRARSPGLGVHLLDRAVPPESVPYFIHWSLDSPRASTPSGFAPHRHRVRARTGAPGGPNRSAGSLKEGGRGARGGQRARLRSGLVVAEVALSLVLLVGASLFMRSFLNLQSATLGFDTAPLMTMRVSPWPARRTNRPTPRRSVWKTSCGRIEALPGCRAAFASNFIPTGDGGGASPVVVEGKPSSRGQEPRWSDSWATPTPASDAEGRAPARPRLLRPEENSARAPSRW